MASKNPVIRRAAATVGSIANATRDCPHPTPELIEAKQNLRTEMAADYIARKMAQWPPLREEQLDRLAALLRPTIAADVEADAS